MPHKKESVKNRRIGESGYVLPEHIPPGEIVCGLKSNEDDFMNQSWRIGKTLGVGGFGEIYRCSEDVSSSVGNDATLAMKIEPHENGPLFVEMIFYIKAAREKEVEEYRKSKGLASLGIPYHRGNGSHDFKGDKYRFLVMDRLGKDLQQLFQSGKRTFPPKAAYNIALKVLDSLEYIHSKGYVHNDIKAQNLLLGYGRTKENDLYLVDFGLVSKYHRNGVHLQYKPDERKAHDGTIEYTSRDAHIGAHSRRSDLEILGYNLVHWMSGKLPWMDNLSDHQYVHNQKNGFMRDIQSFLWRCFEDQYPDVLEDYLNYVVSLEFDTTPNYDKCRKMFENALKKEKCPLDRKLDFSTPVQKATFKRKRKRKPSEAVDQNFQFGMEEQAPRISARVKRMREEKEREDNENANPSNDIGTNSNSCSRASGVKHNQLSDDDAGSGDEVDGANNLYAADTAALTSNLETWSWERVLCSDPELLLRQASRMSETADANNPLAIEHRLLDEKQQKQSLKNPTPAMKSIIKKMKQREKEREQMTWQQQLQHFNNRNSNLKPAGQNRARVENWDLTPNLFTPAMEEVIRKRSNRVSVEFDIPITPDPSDSEEEYSDDSEEEEGLIQPNIGDQVLGRRRLLGDFDELNNSEDHKDDSEQESENESENDEDTESYVNSSDEEDIFPVKIENPTDQHNKEKSTTFFSSFSKAVLPPLDIAKRKRLFSITASPPNGQFHGWKTPPESRYDPSINGKSHYIELFHNKTTLRNQPTSMIETKEVTSTLKRNISQEIEEDSDSDSDSDMFSSQSQQMFSSQNQSPFTPKQSLIMSKAQTPMSEREKELDDQFEALINSPDKRDVNAFPNNKRKKKSLLTSIPKNQDHSSDQIEAVNSKANVATVVGHDNDKALRRSIESVIDSMCNISKPLTEDSDNSTQTYGYPTYVCQGSSSSSGRGSRMSCRSNSSASLPSTKTNDSNTQRRRISIQNEDVPHIVNKDTLSKMKLPIKESISITDEAYSRDNHSNINSTGAKQKSAIHHKDVKKSRKTVKLKGTFKAKKKQISRKDKQKLNLAINLALREETNTRESQGATSCSIDDGLISIDTESSSTQKKNRNNSKSKLKNKETNKQQQKKNFKFITPSTLLKNMASKKKPGIRTPNKMFITPIAARVKKLNRKSSKPRAVSDDLSLTENNSNVQCEQTSNEKNFLERGNNAETIEEIAKEKVEIQPATSTNKTESAISETHQNKRPSFVTSVFAAKIAKSSSKKASKNLPTKGKSIKTNSKAKQSAIGRQNKDDDLVTKYLKKFKAKVSPKKNLHNKLLKTVHESQKLSSNGLKASEADNENSLDPPAQTLPKMKKSSSKKRLASSIQEDEIFKRPNKPVSPEKQKNPKKKKNTSDNDTDNHSSLDNMTNSKSGKRNSLRSSRR